MTMQDDINEIIDEIQILQKVSVEHTGRITSLETPTIDEECIGCAGPCSDRIKERLKAEEGEVARLRFIITREHGEAVKLQKELIDSRKRCDYLSNQITVLEERVAFDAKHIDRLNKVITSHIDEIRGLKRERSEKPDTVGMLNHTTNIETLILETGTAKECKSIIEGLRAEANALRIASRDEIVRDLKDENSSLRETIDRMAKKWSVDRAIIKDFKAIETKETDRLHKIIEDLKDRNFDDLKELYDLYEEEISRFKHIVSARDLSIKSLTTMCQSSGSIRNKLTETIGEKDKMLEKQGREISGLLCLRDMYDGLEVELAARKAGSAVLMKVVNVSNRWSDERIASRPAMNQIAYLVKDCHDASEGPPEIPIDDLYKVTVSCTFLELP